MATYQYLDSTQADATILGYDSVSAKVGFFGAAPVTRQLGCATVATTAIVTSASSSAWCYSSSAQALAIVTAINQIIARGVSYGWWIAS